MGHSIRLRREGFEPRAKKRGLASQASQARAIGVHDSIHSRALSGRIEPSGPYVIGVLRLLADKRTRALLDDLFDVVESA